MVVAGVVGCRHWHLWLGIIAILTCFLFHQACELELLTGQLSELSHHGPLTLHNIIDVQEVTDGFKAWLLCRRIDVERNRVCLIGRKQRLSALFR